MLELIISFFVIVVVTNADQATNVTIPIDSLIARVNDNHSSGQTMVGFRHRTRRLEVNDELCTLFEVKIENDFMSTPDGESDDDEIEWHCELDKQYAREVLGMEDPFVLIVGWSPEPPPNFNESRSYTNEADYNMFQKVKSGTSSLKISHGIVDRFDRTLHVDSTMVEFVGERRGLQSGDDIIPKIGNREVVVVRIATDDYSHVPIVNGKMIKDSLFNDNVSLQRTFKECSYNKLTFNPFRGETETGVFIKEGVVTVKLNAENSAEVKEVIQDEVTLEDNPTLRNRVNRFARVAAEETLGDLQSQFDYVLFILPNGIEGFLAVAALNRFDSYFTEKWILRPSFPLHEIGHNLGMDHAGEFRVRDDTVGYMGFSYDDYNGPLMCFNPANSFYLGWYQEQTASYDAYDSGTGRLFTLNGISDYKPENAGTGESRRLVILRLTQSSRDWDYYIGYNRRKGINSGTDEDGNEILIVQKTGPAAGSFRTVKVGTLSAIGETFEIEDYNSDRSVFLTFEERKTRGRDIIIRVSTVMPSMPPSLAPTFVPTLTPTFQPTRVPTRNPTFSPTESPTFFPTRNPTAEPTFFPTRNPTISPTKNPTQRPTPQPTTADGIYDRDDFRYDGSTKNDCQWVAAKPSYRCFLMSEEKLVTDFWCRKTCENATEDLSCSGKNKDDLSYRDNPELNCDWVAGDPENRCEKKWDREFVSTDW
eukprot:CAMPEP_0197181834 /NCGR_PEP_ID=MMETSP1423-20130617/5994_1 /TAXON_ID=476441 /ORGANISM="Pseudo-nitzschia heimii, Strain UNC1101" /LENGTH=704 /DNA_ID=CAMNT_0042632159 /DNA_START=286 /DNA_END=2397 /DNA_ORIENTATION=-